MAELRKLATLLLASFITIIAGESCGGAGLLQEDNKMAFSISSTAFKEGQTIPSVYTCEGKNISPPLSFANPPRGTQSMAMILHDPDAPAAGGFTHWVLYNIDPSAKGLEEAVPPPQPKLDDIAVQGVNGTGRPGYTGPCPPSGTHRYFFYLYALNEKLSLPAGASEQQVRQAMEGHVIAETQLKASYQKQGK